MLNVWITGASSGIGEACALRYAARGAGLGTRLPRPGDHQGLLPGGGPEKAPPWGAFSREREITSSRPPPATPREDNETPPPDTP